jgi:hypothetical protein
MGLNVIPKPYPSFLRHRLRQLHLALFEQGLKTQTLSKLNGRELPLQSAETLQSNRHEHSRCAAGAAGGWGDTGGDASF